MAMTSVDSFFEFSHRPFRATPDPQTFVTLESMEQEVTRLADAARQGDGLGILTAPPGAGKTALCHRLQARLSPEYLAVVLSSSGFATRRSLLQAILFAFGQTYESLSEQELRLGVLHYARAMTSECQGIVLIVDEAHLLNARLLEELRCLTNHSEGGRPLLRVILCGQLQLEETLVQPALQALNYRVTCHATLEPLSLHESAALVAGRLRQAGQPVDAVLTPEALETICRVSDGNPRCLVQLCDQSLTLAAARGESPVDVATVRIALHALKQLPLQWNQSDSDRAPDSTDINELAALADDPEDERLELDSDMNFDSDSDSEDAGPMDCPSMSEPTGWSSFEPEPAMTHADDAHDLCHCHRDTESDVAIDDTPMHESMTSQNVVDDRLDAQQVDAEQLVAEHVVTDDIVTDDIVTDEMVADEIDAVTVPASRIDERTAQPAVLETPVEDRYAALDRTSRRVNRLVDVATLAGELTPLVEYRSSRPAQAAIIPEEHDEIAEWETRLRDTSVTPAQRIDEVIAALSLAGGELPEAPSTGAGDPIPWRMSGDARRYDLVEPCWEEESVVDAIPPSVLAMDVFKPQASQADGFAERLAPAVVDPQQGVCQQAPVRRPYARLFSRLRERHAAPRTAQTVTTD